VQQWQTTLALAEKGDASALCDVGWAKHKGLVPSSSSFGEMEVGGDDKAVTEAVFCYKQSAALGYAPASSLLGDLYFYGQEKPRDLVEAKRHLEKVLEDTKEDEGEDAYVRVRALRKLGSIAMWGGDCDSDSVSARDSFSRALSSCRTHLGGNFAFMLSHDPPAAFYSHLEAEMNITDDPKDLGGKLSGFATAKGWEPKLEDFVTLRAFTRRLRDTEKSDDDFALNYFQEAEGLRRFQSSGECEWGITFLPSLFRVYGHPLLQKLLKEKAEKNASEDNNEPPALLVLGSALGNCAVWPALAFGFKATGFDILESCVQKTNAIIGSLKGKGAETLKDLTRFEVANVISDSDKVSREMKAASVVWSNDHEWGQAAQRKIEEMAFENMTEGSCLVLYRPPLTLHELGWKNGVQIPDIAVSWNPKLTMYLLLK